MVFTQKNQFQLPKNPVFPILRLLIAIQTLLLAFTPSAAGHFNTTATTVFFADTTRQTLPSESGGKNTNTNGYAKSGYTVKKVVIDPGHGGHDPGCVTPNVYEKMSALGIAQKLAAAIQAQHPDVQVILTRNKDEFIPLNQRAQIANRNNADLFISLHCNFITKAAHVHGSETYVLGPHKLEENLQVAMRENASVLLEENYQTVYGYDPNSPEAHIIMSMYQNAYLEKSILFADKVEHRIESEASRHSRGVKQAGFLVLRETTMPSVLIETGFLSNSQEEGYLRTDEGQEQIALAILKAFADYKADVEDAVPVAVPVVETVPAPAPPPPVVQPAPTTYAPGGPYKGILFKVQLAASSNQLNTQSGNWLRISYPIEIMAEGGIHKYQILAPSGYWQAEEIKKQVHALGFPDAFIVAYQNGQKIAVASAKQQLGIQ